MSEKVIDALLLKFGVTVDAASLEKGAQAVTDLDDAINKVMRNREKISLDWISKNLSEAGATARNLDQDMDQLDKTLIRVPQSMSALQSRLGSATQQMGSFRSEMQTVVGLLSRGASAAGLGPLSGSVTSMLAGGSPLTLATAGIQGLASNSMEYTSGALKTEVSAGAYGVSKADFQNLNRFGKKITGDDDVGTQILQAAQKVKADSFLGKTPTDIARYGGVPSDFTDAFERPTMDVVDTIQKQLVRTTDPLIKQGIGSTLGLSQSAVMTLGEDYRTGIKQSDKPGSTYTDQDVANARAFENSLVDLTGDFERLRNKLGAEFLPSLDGFVKRVDGFLSESGGADKYLDAFGKLANGDIKGFMKSFGEAEKSTQVITPEQNIAMTSWLMENVPFDKLTHYAYDGAVKGYKKDGVKGALIGAKEGFNASPVVATAWLDEMTSDAWESMTQSVYAKMPSAHVDDDLNKPLRPEYMPRQKPVQDPPSPIAPDKQSEPQQRALNYFMDNGYTREQSSGIVANLIAESDLKTDAVSNNGHTFGIAQWGSGRQQEFKKVQGRDIRGSSSQDQMNFILYELQSTEKAAGTALSKAKTPSQAASVVRAMYERAAANPADADRRMQIAEQLNSGAANPPSVSPEEKVRAIERKLPLLANRDVGSYASPTLSYHLLNSNPETSLNSRIPATSALSKYSGVPLPQKILSEPPQEARRSVEVLMSKTQCVADQAARLPDGSDQANLPSRVPVSNSLPADTSEVYNMVANPPTPPSVDAAQAQPGGSEGNIVHIDARGSTDVHHITSEAMRAASDYFQGQMTVAMSHFSTDLDQ